MKSVAFFAGAGLAALTGCGEEEPTPPARAEVTFAYLAPTERNFDIVDCGVGETHIHLSWRNFELVNFKEYGPMEWRRTFTDVPVGRRVSIRVSDANSCYRDPNGATTENVYANGVHLTSVVDTPGNGPEPGLSLFVEADGTVKP